MKKVSIAFRLSGRARRRESDGHVTEPCYVSIAFRLSGRARHAR